MEKIKLFVVDDDPICREDMVKSLEKISPVYGVGSAKDGREAIEKVSALVGTSNPPDVILMDIQMPNMTGDVATENILANHPELKILIYSSSTDTEAADSMRLAGAIGYVSKPSRSEWLVKAIEHAARNAFFDHRPDALVHPQREDVE